MIRVGIITEYKLYFEVYSQKKETVSSCYQPQIGRQKVMKTLRSLGISSKRRCFSSSNLILSRFG